MMMTKKKNNALDTKNKIRTAASVPGMFTCCFSAFCKTNNTSTADNDLVTVPDNDLLTSPDCRPLPRHYHLPPRPRATFFVQYRLSRHQDPFIICPKK